MTRVVALLLVLVAAGCSAPEVSELFLAEREFYRADSLFRAVRRDQGLTDRAILLRLAANFELAAARIPESPYAPVREIEAAAWLRAAQCHFARVDSGRAELILARLAASCRDLPATFGEISLQMGRSAEVHGQYLAALSHYSDVVTRVEPDPGPDPREYVDPDAEPEEDTADDFVLDLPLHMARIAARDLSITDPDRYYRDAIGYYSGFVDDPSALIRVQATVNLAECHADRGDWRSASALLDSLESRIPPHVFKHHEPAEVRLASFKFKVDAWTWGQLEADTLETLLGQLISDYPMGRIASAGLFAMARGALGLGREEEALVFLSRIRRDYPTAEILPEAELLNARIHEHSGNWDEARSILRALPLEYPTSPAALRAPLEAAAHYRRVGDRTGEVEALALAERQYRQVLARYPVGPHSAVTREHLIETLREQGREGEALEELLALCNSVLEPSQRPGLLFEAARRAEQDLREPARASAILQRLAEEFPNTRLGRRAVREARRLDAAKEN